MVHTCYGYKKLIWHITIIRLYQVLVPLFAVSFEGFSLKLLHYNKGRKRVWGVKEKGGRRFIFQDST